MGINVCEGAGPSGKAVEFISPRHERALLGQPLLRETLRRARPLGLCFTRATDTQGCAALFPAVPAEASRERGGLKNVSPLGLRVFLRQQV